MAPGGLALSIAAALSISACATAPRPAPLHPSEADDSADLRAAPQPSEPAVRLVSKPPPASRYRFVGRVSGAATVGEWVETAKNARENLQRNAIALGADVIKIDRVVAPGEHFRGRLVLLRGRAYRMRPARGARPHGCAPSTTCS
jgi:hypothetical protein